MPSPRASFARSTICAPDQRDTPGSEPIGSSASPSVMNKGQIRSDGVNTDEYVTQEQEDGYDAVEWLAGELGAR